MEKYDYIITGAGAAGLSLLVHMIHSGKFSKKKILLLDRLPKDKNDRTWCFWETEPGLFEPVVFRKWSQLWFHGPDGQSALHDIHPYHYKLIRGIDFYNYCFHLISQHSNISVEYGSVENITDDGNETYITFNGRKIYAEYIFNSIIFEQPALQKKNYLLLQHFKGWFITTKKNLFNPEEPILMDFRVAQDKGTTFVYVMPFSHHEALVEYTLFSDAKLKDSEYHDELGKYCSLHLGLEDDEYEISYEESGTIPMTNYNFPRRKNNIINIGSAGGQTKASSGYTFKFIQKNSKELVDSLMNNRSLQIFSSPARFNFYDSILLNILSRDRLPGSEVFTRLFTNNEMREVMKFLDNETSIGEDFKLIRKLPRNQFLKAAWSHMFNHGLA